jgi:hypothetical protein
MTQLASAFLINAAHVGRLLLYRYSTTLYSTLQAKSEKSFGNIRLPPINLVVPPYYC